METPDKPNIFSYRDYREFLGAVYSHRKKSEYGFSYRSFAKKVGSTAPNYLKLVTDGQRNLTSEMADRFALALGLQQQEAHYFCDLVAFNQANTALERERCYLRLQQYKRYRNAYRLDAAHAAYHSQWYIPAIRELVLCKGFDEDPRLIARSLQPSITTRQAQQALSVLADLGFLVRDSTGQLAQHEPLLTTGDDKPLGHHIVTFHRTMMNKACEALDTIPREDREVAALTLSLTTKQAELVKQRLYQLRQELLQTISDDEQDSPDRVFQINFQMFPLSRGIEGTQTK